jgi:hypothetical protein
VQPLAYSYRYQRSCFCLEVGHTHADHARWYRGPYTPVLPYTPHAASAEISASTVSCLTYVCPYVTYVSMPVCTQDWRRPLVVAVEKGAVSKAIFSDDGSSPPLRSARICVLAPLPAPPPGLRYCVVMRDEEPAQPTTKPPCAPRT